jgi:predicted nucleotidyltransferase
MLERNKASILDVVRSRLDDRIWDLSFSPERLRKEVRKEILRRLFEGFRIFNFVRYDLWVQKVYMVGSLVTLQYNEASDIDITVVVDVETFRKITLKDFEALKEFVSHISGEYYDKTLHVINYFVKDGDIDRGNFDAIYDVLADRWVKYYIRFDAGSTVEELVPDVYSKAVDIMEVLDDLIMDTRRKLVEVQSLQDALFDFDGEQLRKILDDVRQRLIEVEKNIEMLTTIYEDLREMRDKAYELEEFDDSGFLALYFSRAWLPPNLVYKFLERYNYMALLKTIKEVYNEKKLEKLKDLFLRFRLG